MYYYNHDISNDKNVIKMLIFVSINYFSFMTEKHKKKE